MKCRIAGAGVCDLGVCIIGSGFGFELGIHCMSVCMVLCCADVMEASFVLYVLIVQVLSEASLATDVSCRPLDTHAKMKHLEQFFEILPSARCACRRDTRANISRAFRYSCLLHSMVTRCQRRDLEQFPYAHAT